MFLCVYCCNCQIVTCKDCALCSHKGHSLKPAEEADTEVKKMLTSDITHANEQLEVYQRHFQTITQAEKHVTTYPCELKSYITNEFDKLIRELENKKKILLQRVNKTYNTFSVKIQAEKNEVAMTTNHIKAGIKLAKEVHNSENTLELAVMGTRVHTSLKSICSSRWDPQVVKELGPLVYVRGNSANIQQSSQTEGQIFRELIDSKSQDELGLNLELKKYTLNSRSNETLQYTGDSVNFIENGIAIVQVTNQKVQLSDIIFPEVSSNVSCNSAQLSHTINEGEIKFITPHPGDYIVTVTTEKQGMKKSVTLSFEPPHYYDNYDDYYNYYDPRDDDYDPNDDYYICDSACDLGSYVPKI
jgi:hypothetical protein